MTVVMRGGALGSNNQTPQDGSASPSSSSPSNSAPGHSDPLIVNSTTSPLVTSSTSVFTGGGGGLAGDLLGHGGLDSMLTSAQIQQASTQQRPSSSSSPSFEANKNQQVLPVEGTTNSVEQDRGGQADGLARLALNADNADGTGEPEFPMAELQRLDDMINRPRWVIPVLPKGELEALLEASIDLCKRGLDAKSEPCQRFFNGGLSVSFMKILTDEAVSGWKMEIHVSVHVRRMF